MKGFYHCGQVLDAYNKIIDACEASMPKDGYSILGVKNKDVFDRLIQGIIHITRIEFFKLCRANIDSKGSLLERDTSLLTLNGLLINLDSGEVRVSCRFFFKSLAYYFLYSLRLLFINMVGLVSFKNKCNFPATVGIDISYKQVELDGSDKKFIDFCRAGIIRPLADAQRLYLQDSNFSGSDTSADVIYAKRPLEKLLADANIGLFLRLKIVFLQIFCAVIFLCRVLRNPLLIILSRDVAFFPVIDVLDKAGKVRDILMSTSALYEQYLWMRREDRKFKTHAVFYSQNDKLAEFKHDKLTVRYPYLPKIKIDEFWVWTEGRKKEFERDYPNSKVHAVGPILWYLPEQQAVSKNDEINIIIFDITPILPEVSSSYGIIRNQYKTENMIKFIKDIVQVVADVEKSSEKKINLYIKNKRHHQKIHDSRYTDYLKELIDESVLINLPEKINLFTCLESCSLSINSPYTSVAYVSDHLKKYAIYYDPLDEIHPVFEKTKYVEFVSGQQDLLKRISSIAC